MGNVLELKDIEDELNTIEKLFKEQQHGVTDMLKQYEELNKTYNQGLNGTRFLLEFRSTISGYQEQVNAMLKSARTAQKAVSIFIA